MVLPTQGQFESLEDFSDAALTKEERQKLRRLLKGDERARWFWWTLRSTVLYWSLTIAAIIALRGYIGDFLRSMVGSK